MTKAMTTLTYADTLRTARDEGRRRGLLDAAALLVACGQSYAAELVRAAYWAQYGDEATEAAADALIAQAAEERARKAGLN